MEMGVLGDTTGDFKIKSTLPKPHFLNLRFTGLPFHFGFSKTSLTPIQHTILQIHLNSSTTLFNQFYFPTSSFKVT